MQTIGYALLDSPIALAAWRIARAFVEGQPSGNLTPPSCAGSAQIATFQQSGNG